MCMHAHFPDSFTTLLACYRSISAAHQKGKLQTEQGNNWVQLGREGELNSYELYILK